MVCRAPLPTPLLPNLLCGAHLPAPLHEDKWERPEELGGAHGLAHDCSHLTWEPARGCLCSAV